MQNKNSKRITNGLVSIADVNNARINI